MAAKSRNADDPSPARRVSYQYLRREICLSGHDNKAALARATMKTLFAQLPRGTSRPNLRRAIASLRL